MASTPGFGKLSLKELAERLAKLPKITPASGPKKLGRPHGVVLPIIRPPEGCEETKVHRFDYAPLPKPTSIRLLKLFPLDNPKDELDLYGPIQCSIIVEDLEKSPVYDALSYTWGDPCTIYSSPKEVSPLQAWASPAFDIYCDGRPLTVATNLFTALLSLRWITTLMNQARYTAKQAELQIPVPARYIWIDALCIDQQNLKERGEQVLMMGRIYKQAENVNIWLGGEDAIARSAVTTLCNMGDIDLGKATALNSLEITNESAYKKHGLPIVSNRQWVELYAFLRRSWFSRTWIVQELALAKTAVFICGVFMFDLPGFARFIEFLNRARWMTQVRELAEPCIKGCRSEHYFDVPSPDLNEVVELYQDRPTTLFNHNQLSQILDTRATMGISETDIFPREGATPEQLRTVLQKFRSTESTDPRDKIYAFVGLSREFAEKSHLTGDLKLIPSYEKSVREVYIEASKFIIGSMGSLELLSLRQDENLTKIKELPSWVPDFSAIHPNPLDEDGLTPWTASEGLGIADIRYHSGDALEVRGIKIGEVSVVHRFSWGELAKLGDLLRGIPEVLEVRDPKMNEKVRDYLQKAEVPIWLPWREKVLENSEAGGTIKYQHRFEVLWRTLLTDCFHGKHPAPAECGAAVQAEVESIVAGRMMVAAICLLQQTPTWALFRDKAADICGIVEDSTDWESAKSQLSKDYAAWQILQGHYPDDNDNIIYPPEFSTFMKRLEASRINGTDFQCASGFLGEMVARRESLKLVSLSAEINAKITIHNSGKLFTTVQGHLGNGHRSMKAGDEVWLIAGFPIPLILRRNNDGKYRLVGDAYVHGIMHGEAVPLPCLELETVTLI
jgi:hypothetical protein